MSRLAAAAALALAIVAAPATAGAATLGVSPRKSCYRAGESVGFAGAGYTPNGSVQVNVDGRVLNTVPTDGSGTFAGLLTLGDPNGERVKTYSAVDTSNTAIQASLPLRVSSLDVTVKPESGVPGRVLRVRARGFTTGNTLYAHVVRGSRNRRNVRIGALRGACRKLSVRKRLFRRQTHAGSYTVQFDTRRHYSSKTAVRVRFQVSLF